MTSSARAARAVLVAAALFTAACSTTDDGPADPPILDYPGVGGLPAADTPAGPPPASTALSDEYLGILDAAAPLGPDGDVYTVAPGPGGSVVALAGFDAARPAVVAEYVPGPGGPQLARSVEIPPVDDYSDLHVAPDGTVLVLGQVVDGDGSTLLVRIAPGATEAQVLTVATGAEAYSGGPAPIEGSALGPDGTTLAVTVNDYPGDVPFGRLLTVDAATGVVTADHQLELGAANRSTALEVAFRPDGGIALLALADLDDDGNVGDAVLAGYDADLRPDGEAVRLSGRSDAWALDLHLLDDGSAVVLVDGGPLGGSDLALFVVRDGAVTLGADLDQLEAERVPEAVAVAPDGRTAAVPYTDDGRAALATVDLATGEVVADVQLCGAEGVTVYAYAVASGVAALAACTDVAEQRAHVVLVG
ncbi:hypothetical protein [Trujillonella endophytica]|uniref:Uncharacterized protein n=1 Tax=Trujillonella endophytica TaxID=673521 RepID=A0A1H8WME3_9ACTN|nr:hypothetical protein [Trujillella endophytica]SEP28805.1 hypothetical protein SAMN05660991_04553 [Trujillella endophytica]